MKNTKKKNIIKAYFTKKIPSTPSLKKSAFQGKNALAYLLRGSFILLYLLIISYILAPSFSTLSLQLSAGDISSKNIKASKDYLVEDKISTKKNRGDAMRNSLPVYDYNPGIIDNINQEISNAFSIMQELYNAQNPGIYEKSKEINEFLSSSDEVITPGEKEKYLTLKYELDKEFSSIENNTFFADKETEFTSTLGINLSSKSLKTLKWHHYKPQITAHLNHILTATLDNGIVSNKKALSQKNNRGILIRDIITGKERVQQQLFKIKDIEEADAVLSRQAGQVINKNHKALQRVVSLISKEFLQPNLTFNSSETEIRKKMAAEAVSPVFSRIKKGEMIVREGEKISHSHLMKLNGMTSKQSFREAVYSSAGLFIFSALLGYLIWSYLSKFKPALASKKSNIVLLAVILFCTIIISKLFISVSHALSDYTGFIEAKSYFYAVPFAAGPMLVAMLFGVDIGVIFSILTFIFTGLMLEGQIYYALFALMGSLSVVFRESQYVGRLSILGAGFLISLVNIFTILPIHLINASSFSFQMLIDMSMGAMGGLITAIVVSSLLPLLEYPFGVTSDIRLLELSNLNHNLLREMLIHAPGTYQHSMVVGSLAEEAAKSVNANYLLARVGSYYHDIGKITKPEYFIENIMGGKNKHDKLNPSMSSLIIVSHIKDGVELANKYNLQPTLIEFIQEHHGADLIRFFYDKAKKSEFSKLHTIKEEHFRYPGPKPQSKETAIVMLADSVEAASRTLEDPTPSRIQGLVEKIINSRFVDGQLEECDLTLKDLHNISKSFARILNGMFHSRVDYPDNIFAVEAKDKRSVIENSNKQPAEESEVKPFEDKKTDLQNIRKLRLP